jgi:hypothetical protein
MISKILKDSVFRLILRIAEDVGPACFQYMSIQKDNPLVHPGNIEILERIFSMRLFDDAVLEEASFRAMEKGISDPYAFCVFLSDIEADLQDSDEF